MYCAIWGPVDWKRNKKKEDRNVVLFILKKKKITFSDLWWLCKNGPHRLLYLNLSHQGVELRKGLEGLGGVFLLEEVCHWGWAVEVWKPMPGPVCLFFLVYESGCRILNSSSTLSAYMPPCFPPHDNGLNLWTVSKAQLNVFLYKSCHGHGVSSQH